VRVQETYRRLSEDPALSGADPFRIGLDKILSSLEARIQETLDKAAEGQVGDRDGENFYRLLGAYRGVSEALVAYAGSAGQIDWSGWREARF
jgi:hypothetical protein